MHWLRRWHSRRRGPSRRLLLSLLGLMAMAGVLWFVPTPYYVTAPGAAIDTSRLVRVQGGSPHPGGLYMLIVTTRPANLFWYLYSRVDHRAQLETRSQFLGEIPDYEQYLNLTRRMMQDSQQTAKALALKEAGYGRGVQATGAEITDLRTDSPVQGLLQPGDVIVGLEGRPIRGAAELSEALRQVAAGQPVSLRVRRGADELALRAPTGEHPDLDRKGTAALGVFITDSLAFDLPVPVDIRSGAITGPSAGLMFTLQIIDQLSPRGLAVGKRVAGTGTIEADGSIGAIGGVQQKVYTAEAAGAEVMLVPQANYAEARQVATRLQLVPVSSLKEALDWLGSGATAAGA